MRACAPACIRFALHLLCALSSSVLPQATMPEARRKLQNVRWNYASSRGVSRPTQNLTPNRNSKIKTITSVTRQDKGNLNRQETGLFLPHSYTRPGIRKDRPAAGVIRKLLNCTRRWTPLADKQSGQKPQSIISHLPDGLIRVSF